MSINIDPTSKLVYQVKRPGELRKYTIECKNILQTGVTISSVSSVTDVVHGLIETETGQATAGGNTTLTDGAQSWETNEHATKLLRITGGTGSGQSKKITSNTATVITVTSAWSTNPDSTSTYSIGAESLTFGTPIASGTTITVPISGGTHGENYEVSFTAVASNSDTVQDDVLILVRSAGLV